MLLFVQPKRTHRLAPALLQIVTELAEKGFYSAYRTVFTLEPQPGGAATKVNFDLNITPSLLPPFPFTGMIKGEQARPGTDGMAAGCRVVPALGGAVWESQQPASNATGGQRHCWQQRAAP